MLKVSIQRFSPCTGCEFPLRSGPTAGASRRGTTWRSGPGGWDISQEACLETADAVAEELDREADRFNYKADVIDAAARRTDPMVAAGRMDPTAMRTRVAEIGQ